VDVHRWFDGLEETFNIVWNSESYHVRCILADAR